MSLLKISDASYSYPHSKTNALENLNIQIEKGEYIALLGTNGSGKSTLARMMAMFFEPDTGTVELKKDVLPGIVFQQPKEQIVAGIVERDTAFGPQNLNISKSEIELRTIECLSVVGLADRALDRTFELSLGQTQRLAFSGILALFPDFLILDECTAMLDPSARNEILQLVDGWNRKGYTVIHITHDLSETLHAKRVLVLEKGHLIFDDSVENFMKSPNVLNKIFCDDSYLYKRNNFFDNPPTQNSSLLQKKEDALQVKNISFSWQERKVFENLSFSLKKGTLTSLTGPSGCGKSTLFECLAGLQNITSGEIYALNRPSLALQESEAALFESFAGDDVAFGPLNNGVSGKELLLRVKNSMEMVGLPYKEFANRQTFNLSGGEKRKLSLAGIIALDSDIMIFDEPTSALDSYSKKIVLQSLRRLADEGKTVLFSTHRLEEANIADVQLSWSDLISSGAQEILCEQKNFSGVQEILGEQKNFSGAQEILCEQKNFSGKPQISAEQKIPNEQKKSSVSDSITNPKLKKMDAMENTKILKTLRKTSQALISPAKIPLSPVSVLPALLKTILFLSIFTVSIVVRPVFLCAILFAVNILYGILAFYPPKKFFSAIKALLPWILIFAIIEILFFELDGNILFQWKKFVITDTKLQAISKIFLRATSLILCVGTFIYTTNERQILDGISLLLKPLSLIKIPVRYAVLVVGIIFRFIPILIEEFSGIIKTQIVRGAFGKAKGFKKLKILIPLFVPLLLQSFRKAEHLSEALTARYFD